MSNAPTTIRLQLRANGFSSIPVNGKRPSMPGWQEKFVVTADEIALWEKLYSYDTNTGVLAKRCPGLDIDITHPEAADAVEALAHEHFEEHGNILARIGLPPKRLIPLRTDEPFTKLLRVFTAPNGSTHRIEILGDGQQYVAFGIHPETKAPYRWHGGDPTTTKRENLPYVRRESAEQFLDAATRLLVEEFGFVPVAAETTAPGNGDTRQRERANTRWGELNERALAHLDRWVANLFPTAKRTKAGGYRVSSADLGRGFEEDLSIDPRGIVYFGVADQGDRRGGRRTAVELVAEWQHVEAPQAAAWLETVLNSKDGEPAPEAPQPQDEPPASDVDIEIARLAKLSTVDYEHQRKGAAEKLGFRASILDELRDAERAKLGLDTHDDKLQGRAIEFPDPEPWPEPVDGAALLDDLAKSIRRHVVMSDVTRDEAALWVMHAYMVDRFLVSPRLGVTSPVKGCGKTTLLDVLGRLVPRPLPTANVTSAALFRVVEGYQPTLLVDEADTFLQDNDELRGILNSGHRRGGTVLRTVGDDHQPRAFNTFCPTAIALIGHLPDTLHDRAVAIVLKRALRTEAVEPFRPDRAGHLGVLARKAIRWAQDHADAIAERDPAMPAGIINRMADNWRPLLAIADQAGSDWPERARLAAEAAHIAAANDDASRLELLLADIRDIFDGVRVDRISSAELIERLVEIVPRPWGEYGRSGKPLTQNKLGRLLKPIGIAPQKVGPKDARVSGYVRAHFEEAFGRYLRSEEGSQPDNRTQADEMRTSELFKPDTADSGCPVAKCEKPNNDGLVSGCPVWKGESQGAERTTPPGLGTWRIRELADQYQERGYANAQANDGDTRTAELDAWLRATLRDEVAFPEHVEIEFERVMQAVFGGL